MRAQIASLRRSSFPRPYVTVRPSREVGKIEMIWMRPANQTPGVSNTQEPWRETSFRLWEMNRRKKGNAPGISSTCQHSVSNLVHNTPPPPENFPRVGKRCWKKNFHLDRGVTHVSRKRIVVTQSNPLVEYHVQLPGEVNSDTIYKRTMATYNTLKIIPGPDPAMTRQTLL